MHGVFEGVSWEELVSLAGELLERGANPNAVTGEHAILMMACQDHGTVLPMIKLLCEAGADASVKDGHGHTALSLLLLRTHMCTTTGQFNTDTCEVVRALLRNGARLDECYKQASAEDLLQEKEELSPQLASIRQFIELKRLISNVRAAGGSYARYVKKEVMVLRALVNRGRAPTADDNQRTAFDVLAKSPDAIAWHILGFGRW